MTVEVEHGILIGDVVLPGTERVLRDSSAWWEEPSTDIYPRPRGTKINRIVGHWTGGNPHEGPSAGRKLVGAMKARRKDSNGDGRITPEDELMDVSVHFGVSWDGLIFQVANLTDATIHTSRRLNLRSVGVECMWPGTVTQAQKLGMEPRPPVIGAARGGRVRCYPPSDELLEAWRWLARALTTASHPLLAIPFARGAEDKPGILEHCDSKVGDKVDAAGLLVGALGLAA